MRGTYACRCHRDVSPCRWRRATRWRLRWLWRLRRCSWCRSRWRRGRHRCRRWCRSRRAEGWRRGNSNRAWHWELPGGGINVTPGAPPGMPGPAAPGAPVAGTGVAGASGSAISGGGPPSRGLPRPMKIDVQIVDRLLFPCGRCAASAASRCRIGSSRRSSRRTAIRTPGSTWLRREPSEILRCSSRSRPAGGVDLAQAQLVVTLRELKRAYLPATLMLGPSAAAARR